MAEPPWDEQLRAYLEREQRLTLSNDHRSHYFNHPNSEGLGVLFHGFTAGTWQLLPLCHYLSKEFNLILFRLPGHGHDSNQWMPASHQADVYNHYISEIQALIHSFSGPIFALGVSAGGAMAVRLTAELPRIKKLVMISPYFWPQQALGAALFKMTHWLQARGIPMGRLLDQIPWSLAEPNHHSGHENDPTPTLGQLYALTQFTRQSFQRKNHIHCPSLMISSDADKKSSHDAIQQMATTIQSQWTRYQTNASVPHAMVHPSQYPNEKKIAEIYRLIRQFLRKKS